MNKSIKVLFWLKKSKQNRQGLYPIYLRVTVKGIRANLSTPYAVPLTCWDSKKQRVTGKAATADIANAYIQLLQARIIQIQHDANLSQVKLTAQLVKQLLQGDDPSKKMLMEVVRYHNSRTKELVGTSVAIGTYKRYEVTRRKLEKFIRFMYGGYDIALDELNYKFIADFEFYLKTQAKLDQNTVVGYLKKLKTIVGQAVKNEWLAKDPFYGFKLTSVPKNRGYLTAEELSVIEAKEFQNERLALVKDIFTFACYTGLRYSDVEKLTKENVIQGPDMRPWLNVSTTKTNEQCMIPLLPKALELIHKYANNPECCHKQRLLPVRSNQKTNEYLKEIASLCGIPKRMTFHLARHTFATSVTLANGVSMEAVGKMLGHRNIRTTQIYAKMVDQRIANEMTKLQETLTKNKKS